MKTPILYASPREQSLGIRYGLFASFFLPSVLNLLAGFFGQELHSLPLNLACFSLNFAILGVIYRRFLQASLSAFRKNWKKTLWIAVGFLLVYLAAARILGDLIQRLNPSFSNQNDGGVAALAEKNYLLTFLATVFLVPLSEECIFRAGVFGLFRRNRPVFAYLLSTVAFALIHIDGYFGLADGRLLLLSFLQYLPAGAVLATAYDLSGTVFAPILIHMAVNAIGMLALR